MRDHLLTSIRLAVITLLLTGVLYPAAVTGVAWMLFPDQADGTFVRDADNRVVGSALLGQSMDAPAYFWPRPSAAGAGYDAAASSGSNLGPTSAALRKRAMTLADSLGAANKPLIGPIPAELLTASASGLDPDISPAAALWQAPRVARARGVDVSAVRQVIAGATSGRTWGFLGEPRVNVLLLNLALDRELGLPPAGGAVAP